MTRKFVAADFLQATPAQVPSAVRSTAFGPLGELAFWFGMRDGTEAVCTGRTAALLNRPVGILPGSCIPNEQLEPIRRLHHHFSRQAFAEKKRARNKGVTREHLKLVSRVRQHAPG